MKLRLFSQILAAATLMVSPLGSAQANEVELETLFDSHFGTQTRAPRDFTQQYDGDLETYIATLADASDGRIGVSAVDLSTGERISILGDQRFPMASTSKIAVAAAYLEMVDQGRASLTSEFPLLWKQRSQRFSTAPAPLREGEYLPAAELIDLMLVRSSNEATDALIRAVGGVEAVNDWAHRSGLEDFNLTRTIATLVRDDGEFDPAIYVDERDSSTPDAMLDLLAGIYQGRWLSAESRQVILDAMERCRTGRTRIRGLMPEDVTVAHKTGTLSRTASDIGFLEAPDGRTIALAIYVTGQSPSMEAENGNGRIKSAARERRNERIATIARAIYDGYVSEESQVQLAASSQRGEDAAGS